MPYNQIPRRDRNPRKALDLEDQEISTSQEGITLPIVHGMRLIAGINVSRVFNLKAREADIERPGKK